jgi:hypothetical protein
VARRFHIVLDDFNEFSLPVQGQGAKGAHSELLTSPCFIRPFKWPSPQGPSARASVLFLKNHARDAR